MTHRLAQAAHWRSPLRRVDAVFGGPVWWAAHLSAMYWLVPRACAWGAEWSLHLTTLVFAALCGRAALSASQLIHAGHLVEERASGRRDVYIGWLGLALAVFFAAVVLVVWIPTLMIGPCL